MKAQNATYPTLRRGAVSVVERITTSISGSLYVDTIYPTRVVSRDMGDNGVWEARPDMADAARAKVGPYHNP